MLEEALTELEALLREERDAIRRLDGPLVLALSNRKKAVVARLEAARAEFDPVLSSRLRALAPSLRQNGILLAHARDIMRDALTAMRMASPGTSYDGSRASAPPPRMLSV